MLKLITSDEFHMLIRTRNSGCSIEWFKGDYPKGTYKFPEGELEWAPSKIGKVINIAIALKDASELMIVRSTDPDEPNSALIGNRSISINYQGGLDHANLYISGNRILMGHFPEHRKDLVRY